MSSERDTTTHTDPRTLVLHLLRLGGFVAADRLAVRADLPEGEVAAILEQAGSAGHAIERNGRISGWTLTPAGRVEHAALLAAELEQLGARAAVEHGDTAFRALNEPFKQLCTRWQMRPDGTLNNHDDGLYDQAVVHDLRGVHDRVVQLTVVLAHDVPRFGRYPRGFASALQRLSDGDLKAFAAPLSESYHDWWMELHQDLLSTLGRERSAEDGH